MLIKFISNNRINNTSSNMTLRSSKIIFWHKDQKNFSFTKMVPFFLVWQEHYLNEFNQFYSYFNSEYN